MNFPKIFAQPKTSRYLVVIAVVVAAVVVVVVAKHSPFETKVAKLCVKTFHSDIYPKRNQT